MVTLLLGLLPLALAAAVSPVMVTEQAVILGAPGGRRAAWSYAAGTASVLGLVVAVVVSVGQSLSLPQAPRLSASLDLLVGAVLVALAALLRLGHRHPPRPRRWRDLSPVGALGFGAFSMATNVTSLALVVPAAKDIAASRQPDLVVVVAAVLLVVVVCLPAWAPVALTAVAPGPAGRVLDRLHAVIERHGRTLVVALVAAGGGYLLLRGVVRLLVG